MAPPAPDVRRAAELALACLAHPAGGPDRAADSSARGWIAPEPLPPAVAATRAVLRAAR